MIKCKDNIPGFLYKYRSLNHSKINEIFDMIEKDYMFLAPVNSFEDKNDCIIKMIEDTNIFKLSTKVYNQYFEEGHLKVYCMSKYKFSEKLAKEYFSDCGFIIEYNFEKYRDNIEIHEVEYYDDVLSSIKLDAKSQTDSIMSTLDQVSELDMKRLPVGYYTSKKANIFATFANDNIQKFLKYSYSKNIKYQYEGEYRLIAGEEKFPYENSSVFISSIYYEEKALHHSMFDNLKKLCEMKNIKLKKIEKTGEKND